MTAAKHTMPPSPQPQVPSSSSPHITTTNPNPDPSPASLLQTGIAQNDPRTVRLSLELYAAARATDPNRNGNGNSNKNLNAIRTRALSGAVAKAKPDVVRFLLDELKEGEGMGIGVEDVRGRDVGLAAEGVGGNANGDAEEKGRVEDVEKVLEVLVARGWDVNAEEGDGGR